VICIENPRVPGSIPGRGTIIQKALHENAGLFCFRFMSFLALIADLVQQALRHLYQT